MEDQPTVVSSADGTNVLINLDNLAKDLENLSNQSKFFAGTVGKALGAQRAKAAKVNTQLSKL